jgi:hypothetical protein
MRQTFGSITKNGLTQGYNIFIFEPSEIAKLTPCKENKNMSREIFTLEQNQLKSPFFNVAKYGSLEFIASLFPPTTQIGDVLNFWRAIDQNAITETQNQINNLEPHFAQLRQQVSAIVTPILSRAEYDWNNKPQ